MLSGIADDALHSVIGEHDAPGFDQRGASALAQGPIVAAKADTRAPGAWPNLPDSQCLAARIFLGSPRVAV